MCVCVAVAVCQTQDPRGWSAGHQRRWTDAPFAGNTLAQSWKFALKKKTNKKPRENKDKNNKKKEMRKREKERKKREGKGMGRKKKGEGKRDGKEMSEKWGKK